MLALWEFKHGYQDFQVATERTQDPAYGQVKSIHGVISMSQEIECD
jgi:hypothetical protein